ncbi:hypothetical protein PV350_23440 [Streptomyces sp. PA03-6a]|nr:hypothetical protein [Streptomyces sp. PA03-6a]
MKNILRAVLALTFAVTGVRIIVAAATDPAGVNFVHMAIGAIVIWAAWVIARPAVRSLSERREDA